LPSYASSCCQQFLQQLFLKSCLFALPAVVTASFFQLGIVVSPADLTASLFLATYCRVTCRSYSISFSSYVLSCHLQILQHLFF
jgi:hypothetical protein